MATGFPLMTTPQGGESLALYNIYTALATVISKPKMHSCVEDKASLLLCPPFPANDQETLRVGCGGPERPSSQWPPLFSLLAGALLDLLPHPSLPEPLGPLL